MVEEGPEGLTALDRQAYMRQGKTLHRWIERRLLGLPAGAESDGSLDVELAVWWERFLATDLSALPARRTPELELACVVGGSRLYARFDLLAVDDDGGIPVQAEVETFSATGCRPGCICTRWRRPARRITPVGLLTRTG